MSTCDVCGNEYDKAIEVRRNGSSGTFDSFECAIHAMAPHCDNCDVRVVGHGVEKDGTIYCSAHCAGAKGAEGLRDRA